MYKNVKQISPDAIRMEREDGSFIVIDQSQDRQMWGEAIAGVFGDVAPYIPPPPPTRDEIVNEWRKVARADMIALQDALIDAGMFSAAEKLSETSDLKWRLRWQARGGIAVHRASGMLESQARELLLACGDKQDVSEWLDNLPIWFPPYPKES